MFEKLKDKIANPIVSADVMKRIKPRILERNFNALKRESLLGSILLGLLFLASFFLGTLTKNRSLYATFFILMLSIYILAKTYVVKHKTYTIAFGYLFLTVAYLFAMILGVPMLPTSNATTFCVLIFALPLLILDNPYRVSFYLVGVTIVFCIATTIYKEPHVAELDRVNVLSFLFLSIAVIFFLTKVKISEIQGRLSIEKERDTDEMTSLLTKAAAVQRIEQELKMATLGGALIMIDIDNFKTINDSNGHIFGDMIIREMGKCVKKSFRKSDILSRFGGDEFVLFLPGVKDKKIVIERVECLYDEMKTQLSSQSKLFDVTCSIGIAFFPADAGSYEELLGKADEALYSSKRMGKNAYTFYGDHVAVD